MTAPHPDHAGTPQPLRHKPRRRPPRHEPSPRHPYATNPAEQHAWHIAETITTTWTDRFRTGTDLHIPVSVVAALALCRQDNPRGPDITRTVTALSPDDLPKLLRGIWREFVTTRPDFAVRAAPLLEWLYASPDKDQRHSAHAVAQAAIRAGLPQLTGDTDRRRDTDLLGALLQSLRGGRDITRRGQFYTPPDIAEILTRILTDTTDADENPAGRTFCEPTAGTGALLRAAAHTLRSNGHNPANYHWYANDTDRLAAACLTVNTHLWGLGPHVLIGCHDTLTTPDWPDHARFDARIGLDLRMIARVNALTTPTA